MHPPTAANASDTENQPTKELEPRNGNSGHSNKKPINKPKPSSTKPVMKKLVIVSIICIIFMIAELVGGLIADSLAIISDAAHMLTDLLGFIISIFSLWLASKPANSQHSFGYHRAGVIGALASVIVIWILTGFLVYFAILRVMDLDQVEINGPVMFGTGLFGLIVNLIMMKTLHGHGHTHGNCHSHKHQQKVEHKKEHTHSHKCNHAHNKPTQEKKHPEIELTINEVPNSVPEKNIIDLDKEEAENNNIPNERVISEIGELIIHEHSTAETNSRKSSNEKHKCDGHSHDHSHHHGHHHGHDHHHHDHKHDHNHEHKHDNNNDHDHEHNHHHNHDHNHNKGHSHDHEHDHHKNENLRAAMIHVLGDTLQSVGVVIAAILIWIWPEHTRIADPICTFIFSILVLFTTKSVVKDCLQVLMEAAPPSIDVDGFKNDLLKINGVLEIHDLHVWCLSNGKNSMSAHITASDDSEKIILKNATDLCRKIGISHTTIQVETTIDESDAAYVDCSHNLY
jgi:zinc transporter 2